MIEKNLHQQECDLFSKGFSEILPLFSRRQISFVSGSEAVSKFFTFVFMSTSVVSARLSCGDSVFNVEIKPKKNDATGMVEGLNISFPSHELKDDCIAVFNHLNVTHFFFIPAGSRGLEGFLPQRVYAIHRRLWDRHEISSLNVEVSLCTPEEEHICAGKVSDFSGQGIGIKVRGKGLQDLKPLDNVVAEVKWNDGKFSVPCEVSHISQETDDDLYAVGLRLLESVSEEFVEFIEERLFKKVRPVRDESDFSSVWDLVNTAFPMASKADREKMVSTWKKCVFADDQISEIFLLKERRKDVATLSTTRVYNKTWLIHTLGIEKGSYLHLPVELFKRLSVYLLWKKRTKFICGLWPGGYKFLDKYYTEFVRKDINPEEHHFENLCVVRFSTADPPDDFKSDFNIVDFDPLKHGAEVFDTLRKSCSRMFLEATDLTPADFDLKGVSKTYSDISIPRRRRGVVALDGEGRIVAFAVCETGGLGSRLFGLMNSFRIYFTGRGDVSDRSVLMSALIGGVLGRYAAEGVDVCSLYTSQWDESLSRLPGYKDRVDNVCFWIVGASRAKAFLRHLERTREEMNLLSGKSAEGRAFISRVLNYRVEPIRPRRCVRLERGEGISGVSCTLDIVGRGVLSPVVVSLDSFGCALAGMEDIDVSVGDEVRLEFDLGEFGTVELWGEIRYCSSRVASGFRRLERVCGVEFRDGQIDARCKLRDFVFHQMNPDIREFREEYYEGLTSLLKRAGYFNYWRWKETGGDLLINQHKKEYVKMCSLPSSIARSVVLPAEKGIIGTHSFYKIGPAAWQLHQLVVDPDVSLYKRRIPTKEILKSTFQYLSVDPEVEFFITCFSEDAPIGKAYFAAAESHPDPSDFSFNLFNLFFAPLPGRLGNNNCDMVRELKEDEKRELSRYLSSVVPRNEYLAYGFYNLSRKDMSVYSSSNRDESEKCIALVHKPMVSSNMLGIFDFVRIYALKGPVGKETFTALLGKVAEDFQSRGKRLIYIEIDEREMSKFSKEAFELIEDLGKNWRLVAKRSCFMTAFQFFMDRYSRLEERLLR